MNAQFERDDLTLFVSFISEQIVRVRVCSGTQKTPYPSFAVVGGGEKEYPFETLREEGKTVLVAGNTKIEIDEGDLCLTASRNGRVIHRDVPGRAYRVDRLGRLEHSFTVDGYRHIYGLGEKSGELNRYERSFTMDMRDAIGYDARRTDPLYKHIPFIIRRDTQKNLWHGLFYDAPCCGEYDLGAERSGYWPRYCRISLETDRMDYYILLGEGMQEIVRLYTDLTGKTAMPPLASIGHMASTMYLTELDANCDQAIEHFISQLHQKGFGCDGYHLSSGYTSIAGKRYVYNWNDKRFPQPEQFIRGLTEKGFLLSPNIKPAMLTDHPLYEEFAAAGAFLSNAKTGKPYTTRYWGGMASHIDMLSEAGRETWKRHMKLALLDRGMNAIWDDNNEYELDDDNARTAGDERPVWQIRPAFSNEMARAAHEAIAETTPDLRPYILTRSGYAGIQRYAQTWAGDNRSEWSALKYNIPIMLGMSVSGVANQGCDIGGFAGPSPDGELFLRWVQNGIFQPRFCLHSCNDDNTITLPWSYEEYTDDVRKAFELRYALSPYFYSLMRRANVTGDPIMRPMAYAFDDAELADESFQFMVGDALLVANVVEQGERTKTVRFPKGCDWFALDTHECYTGGQTVTVDAPLSRIPVFYKAGSIVPMTAPALQLRPEGVEKLQLLAEGSMPCSFTLYQDDGVSRAYERGEYLETRMALEPHEDSIHLSFEHTGSFEDCVKEYQVTLCGRFIAPLEIRAGEKKLKLVLSKEEFDEAEGNVWYFSLARRHVLIRFDNPKQDFTLEVDYRIHDLIGM